MNRSREVDGRVVWSERWSEGWEDVERGMDG